ncbi:hypothetical protein [Helicobacter pylori]|nr:hypothetical protein [Helicobacter pylori]
MNNKDLKNLNKAVKRKADCFEWGLIIVFSLILATAYALRSLL